MIFVDTGHLIALLNPCDELHARAAAWSRESKEPVLVSEYVLWETVNFFSAPGDRMRAALAVEWATQGDNCQFIPPSEAWFAAGWKLFMERPDKSWSLTDCTSFAIMEAHGVHEALAFDSHFEQAGFVALLRRDP